MCLAWQQLLIRCSVVLAGEKYFWEIFYKTIPKFWNDSKFIVQKIYTPFHLQIKEEILISFKNLMFLGIACKNIAQPHDCT